ncbi:MAG: PEP-CTERM sorting domain-containing protein [Phycisphaerae bacterium]
MSTKFSIVKFAADGCGRPSSIRPMGNSYSSNMERKESNMFSNRSSICRGCHVSSVTAKAAIVGTAFAMLGMTASAASAGIIYQDSFNRTGSLNGSTPSPNDTAGATWIAGSSITTSGGYASLTSTSSMAYLPFTPVSGNIYTLAASLNPTPGTTTNWLALGFFPSSASSVGSAPDAVASVMVLERDNRGSQVFNGDGGSANGPTSPNNPGYTTWSIVLNTTQADWTTSFSEIGVSGETNFQTFTYGGSTPNPTINLVGFGTNAISGTVQDFTLANSVPEPATLGLVAAGGLGLLLLKRRKTV